jgi:hypothetical protein
MAPTLFHFEASYWTRRSFSLIYILCTQPVNYVLSYPHILSKTSHQKSVNIPSHIPNLLVSISEC